MDDIFADLRVHPIVLPAEALQPRLEMEPVSVPLTAGAKPAPRPDRTLECGALWGMGALLAWLAWVSAGWATARLRSRTVEPAVGATTRE